MIQPFPKRHRSPGRPDRREKVRECLTAHGLAARNRRGLTLVRPQDEESDASARLCAALEMLGPVFKLFGLYLSTRIDLLSARHCAELALISNRAEREQTDNFAAEGLADCFDPVPFDCRILQQRHRGWLDDGTAVTVKVARSEADESLDDIELLSLLGPALSSQPWPPGLLEAAIADFTHSLRKQMEFSSESRAMEAMARDAEDIDILQAPRVRGLYAGGRVLVLEALPSGQTDPEQLARLISLAWLRQALLGQTFPVDLELANIRVVSQSRIAFESSEWASLTSEPQANLWEYLIAADIEDPDKACTFLLKEMINRNQCPREEQLRRAFRQLVPFRHQEGGAQTSQKLAERLFLQWRFATELGYVPAAHMPAFSRGLFALTQLLESLAPGRDMLAESLRDVRMFDGMTRFRSMLNTRQMGDLMGKYAAAFLEMPQRMDKFLTIGADGVTDLRLTIAENPGERRQKNSNALKSALLIVGAAALLVGDHVVTVFAGGHGLPLSPFAFLVLGALLLWAVMRAG